MAIDKDPGLPVENSTKSFWQEPPHSLATFRSEKFPTSVDFAVIGSGISGTSIALELLRANSSLNVVILEARGACSGATGRNGLRQVDLC
jgi:monoamine oxidase